MACARDERAKRKEADFALGPFGLTTSRTEVVDFTWPMTIQYSRILGGRGRPEVDPWGFLLPLSPLVWTAILTTLVLVPVVVVLISFCFSISRAHCTWMRDTFEMLRILLQQDNSVSSGRWWKRLVLAGWMITALVLVRSYAGNLMSVLAVRYVRQPFQTLRDLLDDPSATMIWQINSTNVQYFRSVDSGIFREVSNAESAGRIKYHKLSQFPHSVNTLVRRGHHVLIDLEIVITMIIGEDFTYTGRCDFYSSRERFLPMILSMIGQKNSPLVPALSKRIFSLTEAGLFDHFFKDSVPNTSYCAYSPSKITVSTSLALSNLWGIFVILLSGHSCSLLVFCLEAISKPLSQSFSLFANDPWRL
ncbi:glutamate receptor ionotropic, delta-2-like [Panulirus ornatus]|uniref:glutamate receptor ionotropic, delta-2-like n=1 Tax=Panulirus ornatus TaxID=150431 RepID=UPI003A88C18D